ncbi:MAG TPA: DM13 domain-containing protein [Chryseolinea sp.]|nr:DM13 domain-containing protein [Chryseolinea sp.]
MKTFIFSIITIIAITSCGEVDDNTPMVPVDDDFDPMEMGTTLIKKGTLMGIGHTVTGDVKVYNSAGQLVVVFDPFSSQNGPDLKVYLSKDEKAMEYLNLGALKSTTGKQSYDVSGMPNLDQYKFVMVWCQEFSVLFGIAELQMP